ncbi:5-formyltetrahydrofolate cyclo-ligase [Flavobacterium sp.]
MIKKEARSKYKALRQKLSSDEIEENSLVIGNKLLELDIWNYTYFHLFLTIDEKQEVDTEFILQILHGKDKEVVVSKSNFETRQMAHFLMTDNTTFQKNEYNIYEPVNGLTVPVEMIDVVFVPLLAYDVTGHRVGYGKGFYDLFLSNCRPNVIKIGVSLYEPEDEIEDVLETDIRLDFCVTPTTIHRFQ